MMRFARIYISMGELSMDFKFDKSVDYYVGIDLSLAQFQGACSQVSELDSNIHDEIVKSIEVE